jgi:hypothetical protein
MFNGRSLVVRFRFHSHLSPIEKIPEFSTKFRIQIPPAYLVKFTKYQVLPSPAIRSSKIQIARGRERHHG